MNNSCTVDRGQFSWFRSNGYLRWSRPGQLQHSWLFRRLYAAKTSRIPVRSEGQPRARMQSVTLGAYLREFAAMAQNGTTRRSAWRLHPLCLGCEAIGRVSATDVTDHVEPHARTGSLGKRDLGRRRRFRFGSDHAAHPCA